MRHVMQVSPFLFRRWRSDGSVGVIDGRSNIIPCGVVDTTRRSNISCGIDITRAADKKAGGLLLGQQTRLWLDGCLRCLLQFGRFTRNGGSGRGRVEKG